MRPAPAYLRLVEPSAPPPEPVRLSSSPLQFWFFALMSVVSWIVLSIVIVWAFFLGPLA